MTLENREYDYCKNLDVFPDAVASLIGIIGMEPLCKMVAAFGGKSFHIPKNITESHPLAVFLGAETALKISNIYSGERIYIPKCARLLEKYRNLLIIEDFNNGMSFQELSRKWGIGYRQVINIVRRRQ